MIAPAGTPARDPLAVLEEIRHHHRQHVSPNFPAPGICVSRCADRWPCQAYRAAAMADAALKPHTPITVYRNADDCGHECPPEPDWDSWPPEGTPERAEFDTAADAWDAFHEDHVYGTGPDGSSGDVRICMLSPDYEACPACSALVYGTWGDDDRFVKASECTVRPAVLAALSGEETPS